MQQVLVSSGRLYVVFFFQAEDGIRDYKVTGVQTCALPIYPQGTLKGWTERDAVIVQGDEQFGERRAKIVQSVGLVLTVTENVRLRMVDRHSFGLPVNFDPDRRGDGNSWIIEILDDQKDGLTRSTSGTSTHEVRIPVATFRVQSRPYLRTWKSELRD